MYQRSRLVALAILGVFILGIVFAPAISDLLYG